MASANEETMLQKQIFPCLRPQETFVAEDEIFLNFVQKHFASSANVSSFARRGNILGNNVSSFVGAFRALGY